METRHVPGYVVYDRFLSGIVDGRVTGFELLDVEVRVAKISMGWSRSGSSRGRCARLYSSQSGEVIL